MSFTRLLKNLKNQLVECWKQQQLLRIVKTWKLKIINLSFNSYINYDFFSATQSLQYIAERETERETSSREAPAARFSTKK